MNKKLEEIAKEKFRIETTDIRNSDRLDFYDVAIWSIMEALEEAYELGRQSADINDI